MLTIEPERTVYAFDDPPPAFFVRAVSDATAVVELANNPLLFNGTNAARRSRRNFYRGPLRSVAAGMELVEDVPQPVWLDMRYFGFLFYRVVDADRPPFGAIPAASTADFDYEQTPAVAVSEPIGTIRVFLGVI